eukprot:3496033-Rhodomonas_salina.3
MPLPGSSPLRFERDAQHSLRFCQLIVLPGGWESGGKQGCQDQSHPVSSPFIPHRMCATSRADTGFVALRLEGEHDLPIFSQDTEAAGFPEAAKKLKEAMAGCDAWIVAGPEYNGFATPLFVNSVAWSVLPHPEITHKHSQSRSCVFLRRFLGLRFPPAFPRTDAACDGLRASRGDPKGRIATHCYAKSGTDLGYATTR